MGEEMDELEQELELVEAMYAPEEYEVERQGGGARILFKMCLERVLVDLELDLPRGFPASNGPKKISVKRSRGLIDSQESALRKGLQNQVQETWETTGRHSLIDLLLKAKEIVQDQNDNASACAICFCNIESGEQFFRAGCWHVFHTVCFAAWWSQVEKKRTAAGSRNSGAKLQRQQLLSAAQSRVQERTTAVAKIQDQMDASDAEKELLAELSVVLSSGNTPEDEDERLKALMDAGYVDEASISKRLAMLESSNKGFKRDISGAKAKLGKAIDEMEALAEECRALNETERRQPLECPMCKVNITFDQLEPFLDTTIAELEILDNQPDSYVPKGWMSKSYSVKLSAEEQQNLDHQRAERDRLFELQKAKGSLIDRTESLGISVTDEPFYFDQEPLLEQNPTPEPPLTQSDPSTNSSANEGRRSGRGGTRRGRGFSQTSKRGGRGEKKG